MMIEPFVVNHDGVNYRLVDVRALDSAQRQRDANALVARSLEFTQQGARCEQRGLPAIGKINNMAFAVLRGRSLVGCWMLANIELVSGPWLDADSWAESGDADIVLRGVPMTGLFDSLDARNEGLLGAEVAAALLGPARLLRTVQGRTVGFSVLSWALFKGRADRISTRAKVQTHQVRSDPRFTVLESEHPTIPGLTVVEVSWA